MLEERGTSSSVTHPFREIIPASYTPFYSGVSDCLSFKSLYSTMLLAPNLIDTL